MEPQFKPPANDEEFKKRCDSMTITSATNVLKARKRQRAEVVKPYNLEIAFLQRVIDTKEAEL